MGLILKVAGEIPRWPSTHIWGPAVAVLDEWGPPREYGELIDTPKAVGEILATVTMGEKKLDNKAVAAAVDWLLLFVLRKATEAELTAEARLT